MGYPVQLLTMGCVARLVLLQHGRGCRTTQGVDFIGIVSCSACSNKCAPCLLKCHWPKLWSLWRLGPNLVRRLYPIIYMPWIKFINSSKSHDISWYPHGFGQLGIRGLQGLDQFIWSAKHRHWALILLASATWCELKGTSDAGRRTRDDFPSGRNLP